MRYLLLSLLLFSLNVCYATNVTCYFSTNVLEFKDIKNLQGDNMFTGNKYWFTLNNMKYVVPVNACIVSSL